MDSRPSDELAVHKISADETDPRSTVCERVDRTGIDKGKLCVLLSRTQKFDGLHDRFKWAASITLAILLLVANVCNMTYVHDLVDSLMEKKCILSFGDQLIRNESGYSINTFGGRTILERVDNVSRIPAMPCDLDQVERRQLPSQMQCDAQTDLYDVNGTKYYTFRLYTDDQKDRYLVQGPSKDGVLLRTDLNTGNIVIGYSPFPINRLPGAELYVDGAVHALSMFSNKLTK